MFKYLKDLKLKIAYIEKINENIFKAKGPKMINIGKNFIRVSKIKLIFFEDIVIFQI